MTISLITEMTIIAIKNDPISPMLCQVPKEERRSRVGGHPDSGAPYGNQTWHWEIGSMVKKHVQQYSYIYIYMYIYIYI